MHEGAVADDGEEQRPADATPRVVLVFFPDDQERVMPGRDRELLPLDACERFEGRSGCGAATRAVTVRRVQERVRDFVANSPALTSPCEGTVGRVASIVNEGPSPQPCTRQTYRPWRAS